ncbi:MAG TPA: methylenetetrahydrofolate reductase [NAD(P)H] [Chromatiales bacterium]|nr:methylenetetrahydrofolate reductase [NAD(P)H] [Thiotrichales bacterium]HIP69124.1 methylenetetrahydrofolate reductase [NAD(P)H] [Chromatiales bacterium]
MESQKQHARVFSFEFFPPRTDAGVEKLRATRKQLVALKPRFFSVTFGAGGSTQERTLETVLEIQKKSGIEAAPHLSCIGSSRENIRKILQTYQDNGVKHIVALRGDMPSGLGEPGAFHFANELVEFIRAETGDHFHIEVAAYPEFHPQAPDANTDLDNFKRKTEAGADSAITQYFFNPDAYFRFIESCEQRGLSLPIVPGIMPITNYKNLARFSDACGAEIPRWIRKRLEVFGDDLASVEALGVDIVTTLCQRLLDEGAPGLHFYTMNRAEPTTTIWKNLGI